MTTILHAIENAGGNAKRDIQWVFQNKIAQPWNSLWAYFGGRESELDSWHKAQKAKFKELFHLAYDEEQDALLPLRQAQKRAELEALGLDAQIKKELKRIKKEPFSDEKSQVTAVRFIKHIKEFVRQEKLASNRDKRKVLKTYYFVKNGHEVRIFDTQAFFKIADHKMMITWPEFKANVFYQYIDQRNAFLEATRREKRIIKLIDLAWRQLWSEREREIDGISYDQMRQRLQKFDHAVAASFFEQKFWLELGDQQIESVEALKEQCGVRLNDDQVYALIVDLENEVQTGTVTEQDVKVGIQAIEHEREQSMKSKSERKSRNSRNSKHRGSKHRTAGSSDGAEDEAEGQGQEAKEASKAGSKAEGQAEPSVSSKAPSSRRTSMSASAVGGADGAAAASGSPSEADASESKYETKDEASVAGESAAPSPAVDTSAAAAASSAAPAAPTTPKTPNFAQRLFSRLKSSRSKGKSKNAADASADASDGGASAGAASAGAATAVASAETAQIAGQGEEAATTTTTTTEPTSEPASSSTTTATPFAAPTAAPTAPSSTETALINGAVQVIETVITDVIQAEAGSKAGASSANASASAGDSGSTTVTTTGNNDTVVTVSNVNVEVNADVDANVNANVNANDSLISQLHLPIQALQLADLITDEAKAVYQDIAQALQSVVEPTSQFLVSLLLSNTNKLDCKQAELNTCVAGLQAQAKSDTTGLAALTSRKSTIAARKAKYGAEIALASQHSSDFSSDAGSIYGWLAQEYRQAVAKLRPSSSPSEAAEEHGSWFDMLGSHGSSDPVSTSAVSIKASQANPNQVAALAIRQYKLAVTLESGVRFDQKRGLLEWYFQADVKASKKKVAMASEYKLSVQNESKHDQDIVVFQVADAKGNVATLPSAVDYSSQLPPSTAQDQTHPGCIDAVCMLKEWQEARGSGSKEPLSRDYLCAALHATHDKGAKAVNVQVDVCVFDVLALCKQHGVPSAKEYELYMERSKAKKGHWIREHLARFKVACTKRLIDRMLLVQGAVHIQVALAKYGPLLCSCAVRQPGETQFWLDAESDLSVDVYENAEAKKYDMHTMLLVGYDAQHQTFLMKNTVGVEYGDYGYVRVPFSVVEKYFCVVLCVDHTRPKHAGVMDGSDDPKAVRQADLDASSSSVVDSSDSSDSSSSSSADNSGVQGSNTNGDDQAGDQASDGQASPVPTFHVDGPSQATGPSASNSASQTTSNGVSYTSSALIEDNKIREAKKKAVDLLMHHGGIFKYYVFDVVPVVFPATILSTQDYKSNYTILKPGQLGTGCVGFACRRLVAPWHSDVSGYWMFCNQSMQYLLSGDTSNTNSANSANNGQANGQATEDVYVVTISTPNSRWNRSKNNVIYKSLGELTIYSLATQHVVQTQPAILSIHSQHKIMHVSL